MIKWWQFLIGSAVGLVAWYWLSDYSRYWQFPASTLPVKTETLTGLDPTPAVKEVTPDALDEAYHYAMTQICARKSYNYDRTKSRCIHTESTCAAEHTSRTDEEYGIWIRGKCLPDTYWYKKQCESQGLDYMPDSGGSGVGYCVTSERYCQGKGQDFTDGDCSESKLEWISENIFGTTITRGMAMVSPETRRECRSPRCSSGHWSQPCILRGTGYLLVV